MSLNKQSVTLLELVISLAILGILVLSFTSIDLFSRFHVISADRRAKIQNEASNAIEHMAKQISRGVGTVATVPVIINTPPTGDRIKVRTDQNLNGIIDDNTATCFISYRFNAATNQIVFFPQYSIAGWSNAPANEQVAAQIVACAFTYNAANDFVTVDLTACWNPLSPLTCGNPDNPSVQIRTNIKMPGVSIN